jgi:hypothetical protein
VLRSRLGQIAGGVVRRNGFVGPEWAGGCVARRNGLGDIGGVVARRHGLGRPDWTGGGVAWERGGHGPRTLVRDEL